jgi:hypothetical protein
MPGESIPPAGQAPAPAPPPKQKGCVFWGCMTCLILFVVGGGCLGLGVFIVYRQFQSFTSTAPAEIPTYEAKPGEYEALEREIASFTAAAESGARIELTADDLNALFHGNPQLQDFAKHAFIRIEGGEVLLDVSIPLDDYVPEKLKQLTRLTDGRYFNGSVGISLSLMKGELVALLETAEVNGKPVPAPLLSQLRGKNLFADAAPPRKIQDFLAGAKSLVVRDGKVIVEK